MRESILSSSPKDSPFLGSPDSGIINNSGGLGLSLGIYGSLLTSPGSASSSALSASVASPFTDSAHPLWQSSTIRTQDQLAAKLAAHRKDSAKEERERSDRAAYQRYYLSYLARRQHAVIYRHGLHNKKSRDGGFKNINNCGHYAVPKSVWTKDRQERRTGSPGHVQLARYEADPESGKPGGYGHQWVSKCGNALMCFECAPKIHAKRREEFAVIAAEMLKRGYFYLFVTFTAAHSFDTDHAEFINLFRESQRVMRASYEFKILKELGYEHQIRVAELTVDHPDAVKKTGPHFHYHCVMFFDRKGKKFSSSEKEIITQLFQNSWANACVKTGLVTPDKIVKNRGCDVKFPKANKNAKTVQNITNYLSKGVGFEMAPGIFGKLGRNSENNGNKNNKDGDKNDKMRITHWEFMAIAFQSGNYFLENIALEIMKTLSFVNWSRCTKGLKSMCGLDDDKDDEDLMIEKKTDDVILNYNKAAVKEGIYWWNINHYKLRTRIVDALMVARNSGKPVGRVAYEAARRASLGFDPVTGLAADGDEPLPFVPLSRYRFRRSGSIPREGGMSPPPRWQ